jgi:glutamate--cysteine ligase catalytic subunit
MGYLIDTSQTLPFSQTRALAKYIKEHGIIQFLLLYKKFKEFNNEELHWGDEIELHLLHIDPVTKLLKLQLNNDYIFKAIKSEDFDLQPEYGAWMLETVPSKPYDFDGDPNVPFQNFKARREKINSLCKKGDVLYQGTVFPLLKVGDFFVPKRRRRSVERARRIEEEKVSPPKKVRSHSKSRFRQELLNPHPRYSTLCENIKNRRGEKVCILMPLYQDEKTSMEKTKEEPYPGFIHMNETLFGTGNTSMQITFGTKNIEQARYLADQLAVFSTIILPLSAASAIFKGKLADVDVRWTSLSQGVDCRTGAERDSNNPDYIPKTRWSTISCYISDRPECKEEYNDIEFPFDEEMMKFAEDKALELNVEIDKSLIRQLGFLFLQDPLIVFGDRIFVDDSKETNHFENIQSTNWNNVRFKPPPNFESNIGWRVELRTMETQLTADECTAYSMFSFFIAHMLMKKGYNFYIPISKLDENMERAQKRDAILTEKFWFRKSVEKDSPDEWLELTIDEILHGKPGTFVGLFNLLFDFCMEEYGVDIQEEWKKKKEGRTIEINKITENMKYFEILSKRAKGEMPTIARWIRNFVLNHPKYQKDSIVTPEITADLINAMTAISDGKKTYEDFL